MDVDAVKYPVKLEKVISEMSILEVPLVEEPGDQNSVIYPAWERGTRFSLRTVVPRVLGDGGRIAGSFNIEVFKDDVGHVAPTPSSISKDYKRDSWHHHGGGWAFPKGNH